MNSMHCLPMNMRHTPIMLNLLEGGHSNEKDKSDEDQGLHEA